MRNRYIYLVFTRTGTWLSKMIYTFSRAKYVHASIAFDNDFTKMYSFGRKDPNNPFSGGFVEENLYCGVFKKYPDCTCMIYRMRVTEEQYSDLKKQVKGFMKEKDAYRYNFLGLFGVLLDMPVKRKNHYFCSQFVSELLINSNVLEIDKRPELIRTNDLFSIKNSEFVWEGFAKESYLLNC